MHILIDQLNECQKSLLNFIQKDYKHISDKVNKTMAYLFSEDIKSNQA
jgi:hypothetical protein